MKKIALALTVLAISPALTLAQSITVGNASGTAGGNATTGIPISVSFAPNAAPTAANSVRDVDVRITYNPANITPVIGAGTIAGGSCLITAPGNILVALADNGSVYGTAGSICTITSVAIAAAAPATNPLTLAKGAGSGCTNNVTPAAGNANCTYVSGAVTTGVVIPVAPTVTLPATATTLTAGVGTVPVTVATAGTAPGSVALTCTIPAGTASFAVTSGGTRTINAPAAVGVNGTPIGLSCTPQATQQTATLSCAQVTNPLPSPAAITASVICPPVAPTASITYTPAAGGAGPTLTGAAATATGSIAAVGTSFVAATTAAITGCAVTPASAAFPAAGIVVVNPTFAAPNGSIGITCTKQIAVTNGTLSCNESINGGAAAARTWTLSCPAATPAAVTAGTANNTTLTFAAPGSQNVSFTATAAAAINCSVTGATNFTVAPASPITLGTTATNVTVTFAGTTPGTFTGNLVCLPVVPATGGPFTYPLTATVAAPAVVQQIPTLSDMGKWLLIASMLGFGLVMVGRRNA